MWNLTSSADLSNVSYTSSTEYHIRGRPSLSGGMGLPGERPAVRAPANDEENARGQARRQMESDSLDLPSDAEPEGYSDNGINFEIEDSFALIAGETSGSLEVFDHQANLASPPTTRENRSPAPLPLTTRPQSTLTVKESNENSKLTRDVQSRLLLDINSRLKQMVRPWKSYVDMISNRGKGDMGCGNEELEGLWDSLCLEAKDTCSRLMDIRLPARSGPAWHNNGGIYADLPLSYFRHIKTVLEPSRLRFYTPDSVARAKSNLDTLNSLLREADRFRDYSGKHNRVKTVEFIQLVGLELSWRGKLGSVDVRET